jgi:hypothetical protein
MHADPTGPKVRISRRVILYCPPACRAGCARFGQPLLVDDCPRREVASKSRVTGRSGWRAWRRHLDELLLGVPATPNGVPVRGLRVLRTSEYRRLSIWRNLISLALQMMPGHEDHWVVLSVHASRDVVARRRFAGWRGADQARVQFVQSVECMTSSEYEQADWQAVLDVS